MSSYRKSSFFLLMCSLLTGCGSSSPNETAGSGNSMAPGIAAPDGHQAAQASFEAADNAGSNDTTAGSASQSTTQALHVKNTVERMPFRVPETKAPAGHRQQSSAALTTTFDVQGCTATFDGGVTLSTTGTTLDANILFDPNGCTRSRTLSGSASLEASFTATGRHIVVTENLLETLVNGDQISVSSAVSGQPTYILDANGLFAQGNVTLSLSVDEHRRRLASTGNVVYDVSITSDANAPLQVVNGYASDANRAVGNAGVETRTIVSGTNTVVHNIAHYTAKHTFTNVRHALATCNCPDSGTMTEEVTYADAAAGSYSRIYTFTACGEADVVTSASTHPNVIVGSTQVTWDSCH